MKSLNHTTKKNEEEKDNFEIAGLIRRTVASKAYDLLKDCRPPEAVYGGEHRFTKEHWTVELWELQQYVLEELDQKWDFEEGDFVHQQILFHCKNFLGSDEYEKLKDEIRDEFYENEAHKKAWNETKRGLMPRMG